MIIKRKNFVFASITWTISGLCFFTNVFCNQLLGSYDKNFEPFFNSKISEISDLNKKEELENLFSQIVSLRDMLRGRGINVLTTNNEYMDLKDRLSEELLQASRQTDIRAISTFLFDTFEDNFNRQAGLSALREYQQFKITDIELLSKLYIFLYYEDKHHHWRRAWHAPSEARRYVSRYIETVLGLRNVDSAPAKEMYSNPRKWLISNLELAKQLDQNKDFLPLIESSLEAVQINYGLINSVKIKKDNVEFVNNPTPSKIDANQIDSLAQDLNEKTFKWPITIVIFFAAMLLVGYLLFRFYSK